MYKTNKQEAVQLNLRKREGVRVTASHTQTAYNSSTILQAIVVHVAYLNEYMQENSKLYLL